MQIIRFIHNFYKFLLIIINRKAFSSKKTKYKTLII